MLIQVYLCALLVTQLLVNNSPQACSIYKKESKIELEKNGYKNILVGIGDDVDESIELIERIKETFTSASHFLFSVTKKRVFFKEITILIPATWKLENYNDDFNQDYYDNRIVNATWESFNRADICIETRQEDITDLPFVVDYNTKCGQSSLHMHFTPEYFLNEKRAIVSYGPYENVIVHEWSHFRYGIFDEYPHKSTENNQEFYINQNGEVEATRCSTQLTGHIRNTSDPRGECKTFLNNGLPSNECNFEPDNELNDPTNRVASIMYKPFLTQLNEFCDNDPESPNTLHNRLAPTLQNKECGGKSAWEVLRNHEDFRDFKNMPNSYIDNVVPKFKLLKKRPNKIVLLIDRSIRDMQPTIFNKLKTAMNDYIKLMVNDNDLVGVIHFESFAEINLDMTLVKDSQTRKVIMDSAMPISSTGRPSNVWNAISLGLILLKSTINENDRLGGKRHLRPPTGGNLIIITSGFSKVDTLHPNRMKLTERLIKNEVIVDTIEISNKTDDYLSLFSKKTDGLNFLINGQNELLDLSDSFISIANREIKTSNQIVELVDSYFLSLDNETMQTSQKILIDETISGRKDSILSFKFNFENLRHDIEVNVIDPTNKVHELKTMDKCRDTSLFLPERNLSPDTQEVICKFERPVKGTWTFSIVNPFNQFFSVKLKVFVLFKRNDNSMSLYPNYYSERIIEKRRSLKQKKFARTPKPASISIDARWSKPVVYYPETQTIYASVSKDLQPILNASVSALILRPSGDYVTLQLFDDGLNMDRLANDGIYTRQFSGFTLNGVYLGRIQLKINENSKLHLQKIVGVPGYEHFPTIGVVNKLDESNMAPIEPTQRTIFIGSFQLAAYDEIDMISPAVVSDLELIELDTEFDLVKLKFTAPGNDGDVGQAAKYEFKAAYNPEILITSSDDSDRNTNGSSRTQTEDKHSLPMEIVSSSFRDYVPNVPGFKETFKINISKFKTEKTFSLKLRATDVNGNQGDWSPVLTIKLDKQVMLSPKLRHYVMKSDEDALALNMGATTDSYRRLEDFDSARSYSKLVIFLIVLFSTIGIMQIAFLIVLAILDIRDRHKKSIEIKKGSNPDDSIDTQTDKLIQSPCRV